MRYVVLLILLLFIMGSPLSATADYYSPRSLSLGMGGLGFTYDISALYNNPALLAFFQYSVSGLSYQNRYGDHFDLEPRLGELIEAWNRTGEDPASAAGFAEICQEALESGSAIYGFDAKTPAFMLKNFGVGVARIKSAFLSPSYRDGSLIYAEDGAPVLRSVGLKYTQYSLGYAMPISKTMFLGASAHLLSGKVGFSDQALSDPFFAPGKEAKEYINGIVDLGEQKFTRLAMNIGLVLKLAETLDIALTVENVGSPSLYVDEQSGVDIELKQRTRASFSFRPANDWGFYGDVDMNRTPVYPGFDLEKQQVSCGIEKAFFQNTTFIRLGLNTDISRKHIFGDKSKMTLSFGAGIRVSAILVDAGLIMNSNGSINGLAIAGYYIVN